MTAPDHDLEDFAALCAGLVDPLTPRAAALARAGVADESALEALRAAWTAKLTDDVSLRELFGVAYAAARQTPRATEAAAGSDERACDVPLLASGEPPPLKKSVAELHPVVAALRETLDTTGEVMPRVLPEIPFVEVERDELGIPKVVAAALSRGPAQRQDTGTVALAPDSAPTTPATPFEKSRPPAPPPPIELDIDLDATTEFRPDTKDKVW